MCMKLQILLAGISRKLARGESLDQILSSYVKLSDDEKLEIKRQLKEV